MKTHWVTGAILAAVVLAGGFASTASAQGATDPFESRRRDKEYRDNLRRQQELAKRRPAVPTFTIPQPALRNGYNNRYHDPRFDPRYDPRFDPRFNGYDDNYVFIPGHYQVVYGQVVYVPPHWQLVRR